MKTFKARLVLALVAIGGVLAWFCAKIGPALVRLVPIWLLPLLTACKKIYW